MMGAMFCVRTGLAAAALSATALTGFAALTGCSNDDGSANSTTSTTERPPWAGQGEDDLWLALDAVCTAANDAAANDAQALLPLDTEVDEHDLATFYRDRSAQVTTLADQFASMTTPAALSAEWTSLVEGLRTWATWADEAADRVEADGIEAGDTPPPGLERFRTSFEWGACALLLDVN